MPDHTNKKKTDLLGSHCLPFNILLVDLGDTIPFLQHHTVNPPSNEGHWYGPWTSILTTLFAVGHGNTTIIGSEGYRFAMKINVPALSASAWEGPRYIRIDGSLERDPVSSDKSGYPSVIPLRPFWNTIRRHR